MKFLRSLKLASALLALAGLALPTSTWAAKVELVREGDAWSLRRDGQPFLVKGAGGTSRLDLENSTHLGS